jgi:cytochrome P450
MTDLTETVRDWATDFDILEPDYVVHPEHRWAEQREQCPIAFTERRQRTWLPVRYEDVAAIAHDVERFSSRDIAVVSPFGDMVGDDFFTAPPITSDPPVHTWARRLLLPAFGPSAVDRMTPITHELSVSLIAEHFAEGKGDAAADYARHIPVRIIALMLGVPLEDEDRFTTWVVRILQEGFQHMDRAMDTLGEVIAYFVEKVAIRRAIPEGQRPDDLLTLLIESDEEGMTDEHLIGTCFLLLVAGIDTTWSAIGSGLWHLAAHPEDQARLRTEPELMPLAVEEILRVYSPVTMARHVVEDTEFAGCPMKAGDKILMAFPAGNRDPEMFDRADEFVIDRERNRHFAFGSGIHRCLGSNLARMELRVALETFLEHVPTFTLADPDAVTWTGGQVRGPRCVPISF